MSEAHQRFLCDAVAISEANKKLFITVYRVGDGIEFCSGRGEPKMGTPRLHWTNDNLKREIALAYGAKTVELIIPDADGAKGL